MNIQPGDGTSRNPERHRAYFEIKLNGPLAGRVEISGFVSDISEHGVCLVLPVQIAPGLFVRLEMTGATLWGQAVYSYREGNVFRTGIVVQSPKDVSTLARLLESMLIDPAESPDSHDVSSSRGRRRPLERRHLRRRFKGTIRVVWPDAAGRQRVLKAGIANASAKGAQLRFDERVPVGSYIYCNDETLGFHGSAAVRYCEPVQGKHIVGIEFRDAPPLH